MAAKPQIGNGSRGRAGMPLARAKRLADKADNSAKGGTSSGMIVAVLAIVVVAGAAFLFNRSGAPVAPPEQTAAVAPAVATPPVEPNQPSEAIAFSTPTVAPVILAPCVLAVERQTQRLYAADAENSDWSVKRDLIRATVQSVLDCDEATFDVNGDFELAESELADLQVQWDRPNAALVLTIVDSVPVDSDQVVYAEDGQPLEFIVH